MLDIPRMAVYYGGMIKHYPYKVTYVTPSNSPLEMEFTSWAKAKAFADIKLKRGCTRVVVFDKGDFKVEESYA